MYTNPLTISQGGRQSLPHSEPEGSHTVRLEKLAHGGATGDLSSSRVVSGDVVSLDLDAGRRQSVHGQEAGEVYDQEALGVSFS